jgi:hypothetical protein
MNMFNRIFISILTIVFSAIGLFGQDSIVHDTTLVNKAKDQAQIAASQIHAPRLNYSMDIGAAYFSASKLFSGTYTSIAPSVNYLVTPKLNVEVGGIFVTGNINMNQNSSFRQNINLSQNTNQYFVYSKGQYALTNRLMLTGSIYTTLNSNKTPQINQYFLDYKGMDLGLNYKIGEHMNIGAQFRISNGYNDYLFDNAGMGSFHQFGANKFGW